MNSKMEPEKQKNLMCLNEGIQKFDKVEYFINEPQNVNIYPPYRKAYPNFTAFRWDYNLGKAYGELSYICQRFNKSIRKKEIEALYTFLESDSNFKIGAITGKAGSGKSGVIYNFCKKLEEQKEWSIYGVTNDALTDSVNDDFFIKIVEIGKEKILLVVDYVLVNAEKIGLWIRRLRRICGDWINLKIRIILIERANVEKDKKPPYWYSIIIEKNGLEDVCDVSGFIKLSQLSDEILEELFVSHVQERIRESDIKECTKAAHKIIGQIEENAKTPLYVKCLADAWIEDKDCARRKWGREEILNYIVKKEDKRIREVLSTKERGENLLKILVFTMVLSRLRMDSELPEYLRKDFKELRAEFGSGQPNLSDLFMEFGEVEEENMCLKLVYPDIIKELLCLEYLKNMYFGAFDDKFVKEFIEQAWTTAPKDFAAFLYKVIEDFSNHRMISSLVMLQKPSNIEDGTRVLYADVLREYTYWQDEEERFEEIVKLFRQLINEAEHIQAKNEIYEKFAVTLFNMAEVWSRKGTLKQKGCIYLEIFKNEICVKNTDSYIDYIFENASAVVNVRMNEAIEKGAIAQ